MDVNPVRAKKLTNIRAAGSDEAIRLPPPKLFPLEEAIVYVAPDELVEVRPRACPHLRGTVQVAARAQSDASAHIRPFICINLAPLLTAGDADGDPAAQAHPRPRRAREIQSQLCQGHEAKVSGERAA